VISAGTALRGACFAWLAIALALPAAAAPLKAEDIIRSHSCMGCHKIPGIPEAIGTIGPSLKGISDRRRIAGGTLSNTPANLRRWLKNPKNVKTTMMPNTGLTDAEIDVLIEFLKDM
jgi:cytochrome c oxidase subunit 2